MTAKVETGAICIEDGFIARASGWLDGIMGCYDDLQTFGGSESNQTNVRMEQGYTATSCREVKSAVGWIGVSAAALGVSALLNRK